MKQFTTEELRVECAKLMGWICEEATRDRPIERDGMRLPNYFGKPVMAWFKAGVKGVWGEPPKYDQDLNLCAELRASLSEEERAIYAEALREITQSHELSHWKQEIWEAANATAEQHARAYLAAKGIA